jgi:hypothetical protein
MSGVTKVIKRSARLTAAEFYSRRSTKRLGKVQTALEPSLQEIVNPEVLVSVYRQLKANAGQAPGDDGVTYSDLSFSEAAFCLREVSALINKGEYRPSKSRLLSVPKVNGKGTRPLALRSILDRIISASLNNTLSLYWESIFLPQSMGFRQKRGPWDLLIQLELEIERAGRYVLTIDDIKDAFVHVNLDDLLLDHRRYLKDEKLLKFIEVILKGGTNLSRKEGIEQGNAYSPTALNLRLHHAHDLDFDQDPGNPPWLRYADNLTYLCHSVSEGNEVINRSKRFLQAAGFTLKGEDGPPVDIREGSSHLMGFKLSFLNGQMRYDLGKDAFQGLCKNLHQAHQASNPPVYARSAIRGWLSAYGPAFERQTEIILERALQTMHSFGFRETYTPEGLRDVWKRSFERWTQRRKACSYPLVGSL